MDGIFSDGTVEEEGFSGVFENFFVIKVVNKEFSYFWGIVEKVLLFDIRIRRFVYSFILFLFFMRDRWSVNLGGGGYI